MCVLVSRTLHIQHISADRWPKSSMELFPLAEPLSYGTDPFTVHHITLWQVTSCLQQIDEEPMKCILEQYYAGTQRLPKACAPVTL